MTDVDEVIRRACDSGWQAHGERLADPAFREDVYRALHPRPAPEHRPLLLALLDREVAYRAADDDYEHFENLYWCAFLLSRLGALDDVLPLWRAKHTNFDTGVGLDIQALVGAGVEATLDWLRGEGSREALDLCAYLESCRDGGDFEDLPAWERHRERYFGDSPR